MFEPSVSPSLFQLWPRMRSLVPTNHKETPETLPFRQPSTTSEQVAVHLPSALVGILNPTVSRVVERRKCRSCCHCLTNDGGQPGDAPRRIDLLHSLVPTCSCSSPCCLVVRDRLIRPGTSCSEVALLLFPPRRNSRSSSHVDLFLLPYLVDCPTSLKLC
jgi:hypothetical protein